MAQIIVVTSGKGGVGKTTTSASFSMGLARLGKKTCVIDFDVGLRNLDLIMGCENRVIYDIAHVIHKEANLSQALIRDKRNPNLYILAASQTRDKNILQQDAVEKIITELSESFDYIICDSPAGIEQGSLMAMYFADTAIVVTNPEVSSVRDSDRILGMLSSKTACAKSGKKIAEHLIVTRYSESRANSGEMLKLEDIKELLGIPLLGVIPESRAVLDASNRGAPVILDEKSTAGKAYLDVVNRFVNNLPEYNAEEKKEHFLKRILKRKKKETL